ncbi:MAG TPA: BamA/TamA family outer membrane protein [bacterium]
MQKASLLRQVLFLIFIAFVLILLMGLLIFSSAKATGATRDTGLSPSGTRPSGLKSASMGKAYDEDEDDWESPRHRNRMDGGIRYNRVEGLYLGLLMNQDNERQIRPRRTYGIPFLYGYGGYAFKLKDFEYQLGIEKRFSENNAFAVGGEYHHTADTPDRWIISDRENSLAAFFLKEDFQDYYFTEGASGYVKKTIASVLHLTVAYNTDEYDSLSRNTNWSLFGGKKRFRENPAMSTGEVRSLAAKLVLDSRNSIKKATRGLYIQLEGEHVGESLGGDYDFDRLVVDFRGYWTLDSWEGVDFRVRAGSIKGGAPWQKTFHLGGISTLRGFAYKAFPSGPMQPGGDRMVLAQAEYTLGREDFPYGLDLGFLNEFNVILFTDAGWVGVAGSQSELWEGFEDISSRMIKNDVGIALANRTGDVRLEVARRTDTGYKPFTFYFRIERAF